MSESGKGEAWTRRELIAGGTGLAIAAAGGTVGKSAAADSHAAAAASAQPIPAIASAARAQSAATWERFCDSLKPLARHVSGGPALEDPLLRTEGLRCLSRLVSLGLDRFLEHGDPRYPDFYDLQTPVRKYMGDSPDQTYRATPLEGKGHYRVWSNVAGAAGVEIGVYAGTFRSDGGGDGAVRRLVVSRDESSLEIAPDGSFEITLSPEPGGGNHLQLEPDANSLLIRTYFWDRDLRRAQLLPRIERSDVTGPPPPLAPETLMRGFIATAAFVDGSLDWWNGFQGIQTPPNQIFEMPDDGTVQTPSLVRYLNGVVALEDDQALLLDFVPHPEPRYWSWTLQNLWGETPDWRYRPVIKNNREVARGEDGSVRLVVSHRDSGHPNWMDMAGHRKLLISLRWRGEEMLPQVTSSVVDLGSLG